MMLKISLNHSYHPTLPPHNNNYWMIINSSKKLISLNSFFLSKCAVLVKHIFCSPCPRWFFLWRRSSYLQRQRWIFVLSSTTTTTRSFHELTPEGPPSSWQTTAWSKFTERISNFRKSIFLSFKFIRPPF